MKTKKQFWLLFVLLIMVIPLLLIGKTLPAAAGTEDGSDESSTKQMVVIHNMKFEKLPVQEIQNTGDEMNDFTGEPLVDSEFKAYDVTKDYWAVYNNTSGDREAKEAAAITAALAVITDHMTGIEFPKTNKDGVAKALLSMTSGGDNAIYLIKQTETPNGAKAKAESFVIGLPSYTDDGTLRKEVHVYPKNENMTNNLKFIKYGVDRDGVRSKLAGAQFILKGANGKYYNSENHSFDSSEREATKLTSDEDGIVKIDDLTMAPGTYEFHEVESAVATSGKQSENPNNNYKYHFKTNPKVTVTVGNDWKVSKYEYYNQEVEKQTLNAPFDDGKIAEAYNYKVPNVDKTADDDEVRNRQVFTYTIKQKIPKDVGNYTTYKLIDQHDSRLELCSTEKKIKEDITVDGQAATMLSPTFSKRTNEFSLTFNPKNLANYKNKTLKVVATMKVKAGTDLDIVNNDAVFENTFRDSKDDQKVDVYGKRFVKVDKEKSTKLKAAEFIIKNQENKYMQLIKEEENNKVIESVTGYASGYKVEWVDDKANATKLISDNEGKFGIYGLGTDDRDYYTLVETKAPKGYIKLKDLKFTADKAGDQSILTVENKAKGYLPMTGGMGLASLLLVGFVGVTGGIAYFRKRSVTKS